MKRNAENPAEKAAGRRSAPLKAKCVDYLVSVMPKLHDKFTKIGAPVMDECARHDRLCTRIEDFRAASDKEKALKSGLAAFSRITGAPVTISRHLAGGANRYYIVSYPSRVCRRFYMCLENEIGATISKMAERP